MREIILTLRKNGEFAFAHKLELINIKSMVTARRGVRITPQDKDIMRLKAIKDKTGRDYNKAKKLATIMAEKIKHSKKAGRRAKAALKVYSGKIAKQMHNIFWKRYEWLEQEELY